MTADQVLTKLNSRPLAAALSELNIWKKLHWAANVPLWLGLNANFPKYQISQDATFEGQIECQWKKEGGGVLEMEKP